MSDKAPVPGLHPLFHPTSIAVVGASTRSGTVGNDILRNLIFHEFTGCVYPVNPKARSILGVYTYPSLRDVPGPVDLGVLIIPSAAALQVIDEAIAKQVKGLVIISAGFKEVGARGGSWKTRSATKSKPPEFRSSVRTVWESSTRTRM